MTPQSKDLWLLRNPLRSNFLQQLSPLKPETLELQCKTPEQCQANPRVSTFRQILTNRFDLFNALWLSNSNSTLKVQSWKLKPGYNQYNPSRVYLSFWLPYCTIILYIQTYFKGQIDETDEKLFEFSYVRFYGLRGSCEPNFNVCIL